MITSCRIFSFLVTFYDKCFSLGRFIYISIAWGSHFLVSTDLSQFFQTDYNFILTGVASMGYSGSYPVSKLSIRDKRFSDVKMDLFGFSSLRPRDSKTSATPSIAFTLRIRNPTKRTVNVSFMLNLPLGIQTDTIRLGKPFKSLKMRKPDAIQCSEICVRDPKCMSWQMDSKNKTCLLFDQVPPHAWHPGYISGQKNTWTARDSMLTLNRPEKYPQSGNTTIATDKADKPSFMVSKSFKQIWKQFSQHGYLLSKEKSFGAGFHGAAAINVTLKPGEENTLTMVLGWFYPNRDFTGTLFNDLHVLLSWDGMCVVTSLYSFCFI